MRLFYFENENGDRIPLNNENGIFLYKPTGLGMETEHGYSESKTGFFTRTKDVITQSSPGFTLVFPPGEDSPYERFRTLMDWLMPEESIYFVYCPYGTNEYYRKVDIASISKEELDEYGSLRSSVSLKVLSPWYLPEPIHINFGDEDENAMRHDFDYDDDLAYAVGGMDYRLEILDRGHIPSAIKLTFKGQATNPVIFLKGIYTGKIYGSCNIEGEFTPNDTLVFSTAEQDSYIKKIDAFGEETDLLDSIDITTNPFFRVPLNEPCEFRLSGDNVYGDTDVLLYIYYKGV